MGMAYDQLAGFFYIFFPEKTKQTARNFVPKYSLAKHIYRFSVFFGERKRKHMLTVDIDIYIYILVNLHIYNFPNQQILNFQQIGGKTISGKHFPSGLTSQASRGWCVPSPRDEPSSCGPGALAGRVAVGVSKHRGETVKMGQICHLDGDLTVNTW